MTQSEIPQFRSRPLSCPEDGKELAELRQKVQVWLCEVLGFPVCEQKPALNPVTLYETDCGGFWRRKVRYGNASDDQVWAWLLIPKSIKQPAPAVICLPGSFMTPNWGNDGPAGLAGPWEPGQPEAYGVDLARLGYVALCPDYPCAGERTPPGLKPYDTTVLARRHPEWTRVGLSTWDITRAVDFLAEVPEVNVKRIGCMGWSQGGQMSLLGSVFEPRIAAVIFVCGWSPLRGLSGPLVENLVQDFNFPGLKPCTDGLDLPMDFDHFAAALFPRPFLDIRANEDTYFPNTVETRAAESVLTNLYNSLGEPGNYNPVLLPGRHAYSAPAARESQAWLYRHLFAGEL